MFCTEPRHDFDVAERRKGQRVGGMEDGEGRGQAGCSWRRTDVLLGGLRSAA